MHRSRTGIMMPDQPEDNYDDTLEFWAAATGSTPVPEADAPYASKPSRRTR